MYREAPRSSIGVEDDSGLAADWVIMSIVRLTKVHKTYGTDHILRGLSATFHPGEKVGMVGANGCGKTTLFKIILGDVEIDTGEVITQKNLRIGYLPQEPVFDKNATVQQVMHEGMDALLSMEKKLADLSEKLSEVGGDELDGVMAEYDKLNHQFETEGGYKYEAKIKSILAGVGLGEDVYQRDISALSGGQLSRLGLARALITDVDLLLLDEPTNHLDLRAVEWLESFLRSYRGAVILISHDRYLLNKVVDKIAEVKNGDCHIWKGNYTEFLANKEKTELQQQREYDKRVEFVNKTRDFIARNKDQEGMRGTARGRATRLERLLHENPEYLERPDYEQTLNFKFNEVVSKSDLVVRCEKLEKSFGDLCLFSNLEFDLLKGERLAITGPNGTGKSTLLKLALGQIEATAGEIRMGENLRVGYLDQQGNELTPENSVLDEARLSDPALSPEQARSILGGFMFSGDDVFKKCANLSGGEQNRLMLCKLVLSRPDVLVLDEPTNHLDIASKEALEEALVEYEGAVFAVSHDRFFLDKVAQKLLVMGVNELGRMEIGGYELVEGGDNAFSRYSNMIAERRAMDAESPKKSGENGSKAKRSKSQEKKRTAAPEELKRFNKYTVEEIEEMIMQYEEDIAILQEKFNDEEVYKNHLKFEEITTQIDASKEELELLYRAYERRA